MAITNPVYPDRQVYIDLDGDNLIDTDITISVVGNISIQQGQTGDDDSDRTASVGSAQFSLRNDDDAYTEAAFIGKAIEIYQIYYQFYKCVFRGYITGFSIDSGTYGRQQVQVVASDWLNIAYGTTVKDLPLSTFIRADTALGILLGLTPNPPLMTLFDQGSEEFISVFDGATKKSIVYSEANRIVLSDLGNLYLKFRHSDSAEILRFENALSRKSTTPIAKHPTNIANPYHLKFHGPGGTEGLLKFNRFAEDTEGYLLVSRISEGWFDRITNSDWDRQLESVVNEFTVTTPLRRVDASPVVLFNLDQPIYYGFGYKWGFYADFTDPNGGTVIQAYDIEFPVAGTDYKFTENEDGTGADLTASFHNWSQIISGHQFFFKFQNFGYPAWLSFCQLRGIGIYKYNSIDYFVENTKSKLVYAKAVRALSVTREYSNDQNASKTFADRSIALNSYPRKKLRSIDLVANESEDHLLAYMFFEQGDKIKVSDTRPYKTGTYYIQGVKTIIAPGGGTLFTWYLKEAPESITSPIAVKNNITATSENALDFGVLDYLGNMRQYSYSVWVKVSSISATAVLFGKSAELALGAGRRGNYLKLITDNTHLGIFFESTKSGTNGRWQNSNVYSTTNTWFHIVVTYDNTDSAADPILYFNGSVISFPETLTPSGVSDDDSDIPTLLYNIGPDPALVPGSEYFYSTSRRVTMKDARIYNRILTPSEVSELYVGQNDYTTVQDGLVFNGIFAPTDNLSSFIGDTIDGDDYVVEIVHGVAGVPYNSVTTDATTMLGGVDPLL